MKTTTFVAAIKRVVQQTAAKSTVSLLEKPAGRQPSSENLRLSAWFNGLSSEDQAMVKSVVDLAAGQATYNFLLVLDGLLAIEDGQEKGRLDLFFVKNGARTWLNDPASEELTVLYKMDRT